jgi:hypothetical protein
MSDELKNVNPLLQRVEALEELVVMMGEQSFGDTPGHDFHGNQWTSNGGGYNSSPAHGSFGPARVPGKPDDPTKFEVKGELHRGNWSGRTSSVEGRAPVLRYGNVNPAKQTHSEGDLTGSGFHVLQNSSGKYSAVPTDASPSYNVGETVHLQGDQSRRTIGGESGHTVVGTILPDGSTKGDVPSKSMPLYVFK